MENEQQRKEVTSLVDYFTVWRMNSSAKKLHVDSSLQAVSWHLVSYSCLSHSWLDHADQTMHTGFCKALGKEVIIARIVPFVRDLYQDQSQHVHAALANQITALAGI